MERKAEGTGSSRSCSLEEPAAQLSAFNLDSWPDCYWDESLYSDIPFVECTLYPPDPGDHLTPNNGWQDWNLDLSHSPAPDNNCINFDLLNPPLPTQGDRLVSEDAIGINFSSDIFSPTQTASTPALTDGALTPKSQPSALSPRPISRISNSKRSTKRKPSKVYRCKSCSYQGCLSKDVTRHARQIHEKPLPGGMIPQGWYECICSHATSRKDTFYNRHLPKCKKDPVRDSYKCQCSQTFITRDQFTEHVSRCGTKPRGRPPKKGALLTVTGEELSG